MFGGRITVGKLLKTLLVSVAVVSLLLAVVVHVVWRFGPGRPKLRGWVLQAKLRDITGACFYYHKDLGEFPPAKDATELARVLSSGTEHEGRIYGPYVAFREKTLEKAALDPWGTPLLYERSPDGRSFRFGSAGPDKEFGTDDDIFAGNLKDAANPAEDTF